MRLFKTALTATTAIALAASAAYANDDNTLYLEQDGEANTALVEQSVGGGGNDIGTPSDPVNQTGDRNSFRFSNAGVNNAPSRFDNDVVKAEQEGNDNRMNIRVWNLSNENRINDAQQIGNGNVLNTEQNGSRSGIIGTVLQQGDNNSALLQQNGNDNEIRLVEQIGSGNGVIQGGVARAPNAAGRYAAIEIDQRGNNNLVQRSRVEGDNNPAASAGGGFPRVHTIFQSGNDNGLATSDAFTLGSDSNVINIRQIGNGHNFSVQQGVNTASFGNETTVTQDGDTHTVTVTQFGNDNRIIVDQDGTTNTATANFSGNGNGLGGNLGAFTSGGNAFDLAALHPELTQGMIFQDSGATAGGNTVEYNVTGDNNLFAFAQIGAANSITGDVGNLGASNGNEVAVIQNGSNHVSAFSQNGGGNNNIGISQ